MRSWARNCLLSLGIAVAVPVLASPDQSIAIRDSLFARTDDHVLVQRRFIDNQGSYYTTQTDTFLLTISLADGRVIDVAPFERARETHVDLPEDGTTYTPLENAVNPYAVRAALGAAPLNDPDEPPHYRIAVIEQGRVIVLEGDQVRQALPHDAITDQVITSINATRAALPPAYMVNGYDTLMEFFVLNIPRDCTADRTVLPRNPNDASSALVRLNCDDQVEDAGRNIYWIVVPSVNEPR